MIARGYHAASSHQPSLLFSESVLDGSINEGETELNLDSLPVMPEAEKRGRTIKRSFDRSRVIENEDEKEFELEELPAKSQRRVIESSDEENAESKDGNGENEGEDAKKEASNEKIGRDGSNDSTKAAAAAAAAAAISSSKEMDGLIVDSKSEDERREFIQSNLKRLAHRMSQESVVALMEAFLSQ